MKAKETQMDIYERDKEALYTNAKESLKASNITDHNKALIGEYVNFLFAKGSGTLRAIKVMGQLKSICMTIASVGISSNLDELSFKDIERLVSAINLNTLHTDATKGDYRRMIRAFYNWFREHDDRITSDVKQERETAMRLYDYISKHVSQSYKHNIVDYSNIITKEDCDKLIDNAPNVMEKAIISVLHETGCRIGEFLGMRIRDIEIKDNYALLRVNGKTGERRIPIQQSLPYLLRYLDEHVDKHNVNALLWLSKSNKYKGEPLHYTGIKLVLERAYKQANITKKCNPHWFRHSRATLLASDYPEQTLCKIMGWQIGSKQVRTYVHIGTKQVEDAFKQVNGLTTTEQATPKIQVCVCGTMNEPQAKYCYKCGKALCIGTFVQDQETLQVETDNTIKLLMEIMQNPELLQKFKQYQQARA